MGFLSFYGSVRGFTVADQDLRQTFHQGSIFCVIVNAGVLVKAQLIRHWQMLFHQTDIYLNIVTSLQPYLFIYSQLQLLLIFLLLVKPRLKKTQKKHGPTFASALLFPATLQPCLQSCSQPWRVLFLERQPRLRHFESHRVRDSWAEALWTQNEDDWMWGWLCRPRAIVCTNHGVFTWWGLHVYLRNQKKGPCGFLFIPLQNNYHITRWKN